MFKRSEKFNRKIIYLQDETRIKHRKRGEKYEDQNNF